METPTPSSGESYARGVVTIDWTVSFEWREDIQIGKFRAVKELLVKVAGYTLPIDWKNLKKFQPILFEEIKKDCASKGKPISDWG